MFMELHFSGPLWSQDADGQLFQVLRSEASSQREGVVVPAGAQAAADLE